MTRQLYLVSPPAAQYLDLTDECEAECDGQYRCKGRFEGFHGHSNYCVFLDRSFAESRRPLNAVVRAVANKPWILTSPTTLTAIRADLWEKIEPFFPSPVVGQLRSTHAKQKGEIPFVTVYCEHKYFIDCHRGANSLHNQCPLCRGIHYVNSSVDRAVVEYSLGNALVFTDNGRTFALDGELIERLELKKNFPELRFRRVPVIPKPLDNDVLPGDPGWSGTFVPQNIRQISIERSVEQIHKIEADVAKARSRLNRPTEN